MVPLTDTFFDKIGEVVVPQQADHEVVCMSGVDLADTFLTEQWKGGYSSQSCCDTAVSCDENQELEDVSLVEMADPLFCQVRLLRGG